MRKLKNWGFYALFIFGGILDLGFNEIQPVLQEIGVGAKSMGFIRLLIIILGALKLKLSLPTQNIEKLKDIVQEKDLCDDVNIEEK